MKKTLVAVAALAATGAFAQVTITGFFNGSYDNFSITNPNASRTGNTSENRVTDNSSRIIFGVTEKLTNDLSAIGQFDLRFSVDQMSRVNATCATPAVAAQTAITNANLNGPTVPAGVSIAAQTASAAGGCAVNNPVSAGNSHLGLSSASLGTLRLGRQDIHYTENGNFNPVGLGLLHQAATVATTAAAGAAVGRSSRTANLLWWTSPTYNGFTGTVGYSTNGYSASGQQDTENDMASGQRKGGSQYFRLGYASGPLNLAYSNLNEKSDWIGTASDSTVAGSAAAAAQAAQSAQADRNGSIYSAKYDFGTVKLGAAYFQNESQAYAAGVAGATSKRSAYQLGHSPGCFQRCFYLDQNWCG